MRQLSLGEWYSEVTEFKEKHTLSRGVGLLRKFGYFWRLSHIALDNRSGVGRLRFVKIV